MEKATNGWRTDSRDVNILFDEENESRIFAIKNQMDWILGKKDNYNPKKSAFFRFAKAISAKILEKSSIWTTEIAWTNLYKVSHKSGNPDAKLKKAQLQICKEILKTEIEILKPKYIVFLTSHWEDEFIKYCFDESLNTSITSVKWGENDKYFSKVFLNEKAIIIRTLHPQGKNEQLHLKAITNLLERISDSRNIL